MYLAFSAFVGSLGDVGVVVVGLIVIVKIVLPEQFIAGFSYWQRLLSFFLSKFESLAQLRGL